MLRRALQITLISASLLPVATGAILPSIAHADAAPNSEPVDQRHLMIEGAGPAPEPTPVACLRDPMRLFCQVAPVDLVEAESPESDSVKARRAIEAPLMQESMITAKAAWSRLSPAPKEDEDGLRQYWEIVHQHYARKLESVDRARFRATLEEVREDFARTLESSRLLSADERTRLVRLAGICLTRPRINPTYGQEARNAKIQSEIPSMDKCTLELSAKTWRECAAASPICYQMLFHELGHLMDPCSYLPFPAVHGLGSALLESTECLSGLAELQLALPNACGRSHAPYDGIPQHCGFGAASTHPSQWKEASSDFWGASALATYLTRKFPDSRERARAFARVSAQWCLEASLSPPVKPEASGGSCESQIREDYRANAQAPHSEYLEFKARFDRNALRNADLRKALGCRLSEEVPTACSPLGYATSLRDPAGMSVTSPSKTRATAPAGSARRRATSSKKTRARAGNLR